MENITIEGNLIRAVSPEGKTATMKLQDVFQKIAPRRMDTCGVALPNGTRFLYSEGPITIWVHETPPRVFQFKWISNDSPVRYGKGAKYRMVRIALPYLIVVAAFEKDLVGDFNECFFRASPLRGEDDELLYPALLNCSRFQPQDGKPLSWICTQKLDRSSFTSKRDPSKRMLAGFQALMHSLLEAGFNYSSEHHEYSSWFTESTRVDRRIANVERWQQATAKDPLFVLDVPWLKTGMTVKQVVERMIKNKGTGRNRVITASDLARVIFNQRPTRSEGTPH